MGVVMKEMLSRDRWSRNVGTGGFPVSFLHEYAVALIYDRLSLRGQLKLPLLNGEWSGDVLEGVANVGIPDSLQPIGGYLPDIALYGDSYKVIRVIEVVVTSACSEDKIHSLERRGVEVLQVPARNENELRAIFPSPYADKPWWPHFSRSEEVFMEARRKSGVNWEGTRHHRILSGQQRANKVLEELMTNLSMCSPYVRRAFVNQLKAIDSLDSLYPIRQENPKLEVLGLGKGSESPEH